VHLRRDAITTPVSYEAGYIVLSFFTSLAGCVTTLELTSSDFADDWMIALASLASCRPEIGVLLRVVIDHCFFFYCERDKGKPKGRLYNWEGRI
jgi:hypothetical protein